VGIVTEGMKSEAQSKKGSWEERRHPGPRPKASKAYPDKISWRLGVESSELDQVRVAK
jgi:hypothetical protein